MLQVGLLASKVGLIALKALHSTTAALELYENVLTPISSKQAGVGPPPPETPQMLPSVHAMWGPLVGALKVSVANVACHAGTPCHRFESGHCEFLPAATGSLVHCQAHR